MGTDFFCEEQFSGLLDRVRDQDRISSMEAAVREYTTRLFSADQASPVPGSASSPPPSSLELEPVPDSQVCTALASMIKQQLVKSHEEVVKRFGQLEEVMEEEFKEVEVAKELMEMSTTTAQDAQSPTETLESPSTPGSATASFLSPESFQMVESVPVNHKFKLTLFQPNNSRSFLKHVRQEMRLLQSSLPPGILVRGFEDRMDLVSAMIHGPKNTPYEDGVFLFDFQLPADYPTSPPSCHYLSHCSDRLNPNLYEDGKVCVSLLGTWQGKGTETWNSQDSNLLQVLVSIQGLILVREPYFNEAGYEKQRGAQMGCENSRMYNEMAVLKLVQSMTRMARCPPEPFKREIVQHLRERGECLAARLEGWREVSLQRNRSVDTPSSPAPPLTVDLPDFPLVPASKGFCLTLERALVSLREALAGIQAVKELELD